MEHIYRMKLSALITVVLAALAAGLIVFWNLRDHSISSSATPTAVTESTEIAPERVDPPTSETVGSVNSESDQLERSTAEQSTDSRLAMRQRDWENTMYEQFGNTAVQELMKLGLAQADSEAIARRLAADLAECSMASLMAEAQAQSISVEELFSRLDAASRDGGDPFDVVELSRVTANSFACEADAMQRAGIPYPSGAQVSEEDTKRFMECVAGFNDSDIVDRGVILEICTEEVFGEVP